MIDPKNTINQVILNNQKIDSILKEENKQRTRDIKEEEKNSNSFNQLLSLQLLIHKHSGLKELCKYFHFYLFINLILYFLKLSKKEMM